MSLCKNGHDKDLLGTDQDNRCSECRRQAQRRRKREARERLEYRCSKGHDKRVVGIAGNGACLECMRYCIHGHDRRVYGVAKNGTCLECKRKDHRAWSKKYWERRSRESPYSRKGARYLPKLRSTRVSLGLSAQELADMTGIDVSSIAKYERCESRCRPHNLQKILPIIASRITEKRWEALL